jgi:outer membrane biosynthesis protein TonB
MQKYLVLICILALAQTGFAQNQKKDLDKLANNELAVSVVGYKPAEPKNGMEEIRKYIDSRLIYPKGVPTGNTDTKVLVEFIVGHDGKISNTKAVHSAHDKFSEEAIRVVSSMPAWIPASHEGQNIKTKVMLTVSFAEQHKATARQK